MAHDRGPSAALLLCRRRRRRRKSNHIGSVLCSVVFSGLSVHRRAAAAAAVHALDRSGNVGARAARCCVVPSGRGRAYRSNLSRYRSGWNMDGHGLGSMRSRLLHQRRATASVGRWQPPPTRPACRSATSRSFLAWPLQVGRSKSLERDYTRIYSPEEDARCDRSIELRRSRSHLGCSKMQE